MIGELWVEDAFGGLQFGTFIQTYTTVNLCIINPPGKPEIRCASKKEFEDLALKYFGTSR